MAGANVIENSRAKNICQQYKKPLLQVFSASAIKNIPHSPTLFPTLAMYVVVNSGANPTRSRVTTPAL
jgi:hypothetical protein